MNILFLTWKDIKHPNKGGAEIVMYQYAKGLVERGHNVTWFASGFDGGVENEIIDGIKIIRKFRIHNIYFLAWSWYKKYKKSNKVDLIIDEAGGIPLFSPFYEKKIPIVFMIHHVGEKEWDYKFIFPLNVIFRNIFKKVIQLYKKNFTITVSNSTKSELVDDFGFLPDKVTVIENALNIKPIDVIAFEKKQKSILFFGRLTQIKRVEDAILGFAEFCRENDDYVLNIVGNEQEKEYANTLKRLVKERGLEQRVFFRGYSREIANEYLEISQISLVPSYKEGFGLVVLEANAYGLPVIGYDVAGLRDSIQEGINGFKVQGGDFKKIAEILQEVLGNEEKYKDLAQSSLQVAKDFYGWDKKIDELEKFILEVNNNHGNNNL